jgi:hypothetical protein
MLFNDLSTFEKRFLNVKLVFEIGALKPRFWARPNFFLGSQKNRWKSAFSWRMVSSELWRSFFYEVVQELCHLGQYFVRCGQAPKISKKPETHFLHKTERAMYSVKKCDSKLK